MKRWMLAVTMLVGCTDDPPSCQVAVTHFYGVGCTFSNLSTNPPTNYTLNESIQSCKDVNAAVPDRCQDKFDAFVTCLNEVKDSSACATCSDEQDALFGCD